MSRPAEAAASGPCPSATGLPGPGTAIALLGILALFFALTGSFEPSTLPSYASSSRQVTGMALMLMLLPPYLVFAASIGQRRSFLLIEEVRPRLPDPRAADAAAATIRGALRRTWPWGVGAGLAMGLLNTQPHLALRSNAPVVAGALSAGPLLRCRQIGLLLCVRITSAHSFRRLAAVVRLDLLRPDRLRPLARAGVIDVVIIAGALLLTPLQSIDAEFRWYNYHFGLLVAVPAAVFFLGWPLQPLHRRNRAERDARIDRVDEQIAALGASAAPPASPDASIRLEALLAHRDRLRGARIWPLSTGLLSRVLLYLVIPPLAWAGAALAERAVDTLLGG